MAPDRQNGHDHAELVPQLFHYRVPHRLVESEPVEEHDDLAVASRVRVVDDTGVEFDFGHGRRLSRDGPVQYDATQPAGHPSAAPLVRPVVRPGARVLPAKYAKCR
ncbi:hypothetical protein AB0A77_13650 [Streptomyces varsoviensis]|uniref:hypothetical protein n=1 Tax=Streptomyces varsoviensis TaxID=67373 RepID=UPI0033F1638C